jgi:hypothetical protein
MKNIKHHIIFVEVFQWKKKIEHFQLENVNMKIQLAFMTRETIGNYWLDVLEETQTQLLNLDRILNFVRKDLALMLVEFEKENLNGHAIDIESHFKKLKIEFNHIVAHFNKIKSNFNGLLLQNVIVD